MIGEGEEGDLRSDSHMREKIINRDVMIICFLLVTDFVIGYNYKYEILCEWSKFKSKIHVCFGSLVVEQITCAYLLCTNIIRFDQSCGLIWVLLYSAKKCILVCMPNSLQPYD